MNQCIHQHSMKMNEIFVYKCIFINDYDVKIMKLCYIIEIYKIYINKIEESHSYIHDYLLESSSTEESFCLQIKVQRQNKKTQQPSHITHLITNIAYKLKPHHTRNKYLRAWIDTGTKVNLMPVSVYKLIYQDNDLQKLSQCNLKIGTYTADTINIISTTVIYLIHPDIKQPTETTFHITSSKGSVLLSCNASLQLGLIQHRPRLNYLPPQASLITSKEDHPKSAASGHRKKTS